jgi:outer membrane lipoprotein carrier protein
MISTTYKIHPDISLLLFDRSVPGRALRKLYHFQATAVDRRPCSREMPYKLWKSLLQFFLLLMIFFPLPLQAEEIPLDELVTRIQERYEKAIDLKAKFVQETTIKSIRKVDREEGTVYFKKPKKMLWDYSKPKSKKLVINPRKAWLYVPEENLVYVQDTKKILNSKMVIRFLTGVGSLKEDFNVRYARPQERDSAGNYLLELTPRASGAGVDHLLLTIDGTTYQILACSLRDTYGNLTRITFRDIQVNNNLPDSLFSFTPPPGALVQPVP